MKGVAIIMMVAGAIALFIGGWKFAVVGYYPSIISDWIGFAILGLAGLVVLWIGQRMYAAAKRSEE